MMKEEITKMRTLLANKDNETPEAISSAVHDFQQKSLKVFEAAYKKVSSDKKKVPVSISPAH